ncbi:sulfotransferase ssu-1 [Rhipicephalus sanguineus]|uniref:Sulfotransferase domain-containing protein n=1 Tax=Rhipicephalus sanguineus TaxID=34632 RepID=A0A9D4Q2C9_RHISA|nr:sulfotransferase ssu-1 [Rhipicephalus sanguineus]KAH7962737.1 hypothetical protein HPB52_017737 [Rhipicephalus sanguineus]
MAFTRAPVYQVVDGLKYSRVYMPEHVRAVRSYKPQDGDLVLVSYLKCGNNWLEQIIQLILHGGESAQDFAEFHRRCPYPELYGLRYLDEMESPRFFKTHFRYEHQLKNPKAKFIYLARNPLDVCVSFFYYTLYGPQYDFENCSFGDFVEAFVNGEVDHGDYLDHLLSWYAHRHEENVFFITFEELKRDFSGTVISLAGFMGDKYRNLLDNEPHVLRNVVEKSSVSFMSKLCSMDKEVVSVLTEKDAPFSDACRRFHVMNRRGIKGPVIVRKGIVGDWKAHFENRHLEFVRQWIEKKGAVQVIRELWGDLDLGGIV